MDAQAKAKSCEKRSARAKAAAEKAEKLRSKAKLAEEKAERAKQKLEGKGKGNKRSKKCHDEELDAGVDRAAAAEPVKPPTTRKRRKQPDAHAPVETPADPKKLKVQQAFLDLLATGIEDLKTELGDRKSFTVKPAPDLRCRAAPGWPSPIGVVLVSRSFYVNRCMVAKESWPKELLDLYTVGI